MSLSSFTNALAPISEEYVDSVLLGAGLFSTTGGFGSKINVLNVWIAIDTIKKVDLRLLSMRLEGHRPDGQNICQTIYKPVQPIW